MANLAQTLRFDADLASRLLAQAPRWAMGLLVVLLGVRAALLVADLAGPVATPAASNIQPLAAAPRNAVDTPAILRANLFGQAPAAAGNAPVTTMALLLGGVIADTDDQRGFALIGTGSTDIKFYKVGDTVPGGARLAAVQVDRVLLERGGRLEALLLPPRSSAVLGSPPQVAVAPPPMASLDRVQQVMRDNPGFLGQVLQRQAVFADGKLRGMRVYPGPNAVAFGKLGLRPGDLVTAINGSRLDDQTRSAEVFNTLASAAEAHITVERSGREQDLVLNLAQVANEAEQLSQPLGTNPAEAPAPGTDPAGTASAR